MRNPATFLPYFVRTGNQNKEKLKDYLQENDYIVFTIKNSTQQKERTTKSYTTALPNTDFYNMNVSTNKCTSVVV